MSDRRESVSYEEAGQEAINVLMNIWMCLHGGWKSPGKKVALIQEQFDALSKNNRRLFWMMTEKNARLEMWVEEENQEGEEETR